MEGGQSGGGLNTSSIIQTWRTFWLPYLDKSHWSFYIHEEKQCIHCDHVRGFHNDVASKEFAHKIFIAWALSRGLNENDEKFATFVNVNTIVPKVFVQKNSCECGHQIVLNFKTYLLEWKTSVSLPCDHVSWTPISHGMLHGNIIIPY
jgi:hypothetical protein